MDRNRALRKVLACLRLARSSNPHEAAAALRQAQALMAKYGLTEDDAAASEIANSDAPTRSRGAMVPKPVLALAVVIANGYRCECAVAMQYSERFTRETVMRFFGAGADAQVAAYAFSVLRRQLESAKAKHTSRIRKRANRERRGEAFAFGWVHAVRALFPRVELSTEHERALQRAVEINMPGAEQSAGRDICKPGLANEKDTYAGYLAGKSAQLRQGLTESGQRRLESV